MPDPRGYPAYYMRYGIRYVAWFCEPDAPESFLEWRSEPYDDYSHGWLAAIGTEPEPGQTYTDVGHEYCYADDCPQNESDDDN